MNEEVLKKVRNAKKNLIISGDISVGKTTKLCYPLMEEIIKEKESFLVLDTKKEYINRYYELVKNNEYNIVILNLKDLKISEGWNPLEYPYNLYKNGNKDKAMDYLENIGKVLFYEGKTIDPYWSTQAVSLFEGIVLGLFQDANENEINFSSVNALFNANDKKFASANYLTEYFKMKDINDSAYICASSSVFVPKETKEGIISVAKQKIKPVVSRELLNKLLSKTTFNLQDCLEKPTAIFLIGKDEKSYLSPIMSMFIEQLYSILIDNNSKNKFNFIIDNFDILTNLCNLVNMLSTSISNNMKITLITRSTKQLEEEYGDYVYTLSDNVKIDDKDIEFTLGSEKTKLTNDKENVEMLNINVEYPTLEVDDVKVFDCESFVYNNKKDVFDMKYGTPISSDSPFKSANKNTNVDVSETLNA